MIMSKQPRWFQWYTKKEDAQVSLIAFRDVVINRKDMASKPFSKYVSSLFEYPFSTTLKKIVFISKLMWFVNMNVSLEMYYLEMEEREIEIIEGQSVFQPTEK